MAFTDDLNSVYGPDAGWQPVDDPLSHVPQNGGMQNQSAILAQLQQLIQAQKMQQLAGGISGGSTPAATTQPNDIVKQILGGRFESQPNFSDVADATLQSAMGHSYVSPDTLAENRLTSGLAALKTIGDYNKDMAMTNLYSAGGSGNQTLKLAQSIMAENPGMSLADAVSFVKSSGTVPLTVQNGQITNLQGSTDAMQNASAAKAMGGAGVDIATSAEIERQKLIGKGEISPIAAKEQGQKNLAIVAGQLNSQYNALDKMGAVVNPANSTAANLSASTRSSVLGQAIGKRTGTQEQSVRNTINSMEPLLINAIRQATGMSAKAMDSNAELAFYRQAVRSGDIQAQRKAINTILQVYGGGPAPTETNVTPNAVGGSDFSHLWSGQ